MPNLVPRMPPPALILGRRALEAIHGYRLLGDLVWHDDRNRWTLHFQLTIDKSTDGLVPRSTAWWVLIEDCYPYGEIRIFPARDGGLSTTFPHQRHNAEARDDRLWRTGEICVTTPGRVLGKLVQAEEPTTSELRLAWHIERSLLWLDLAANGELRLPGMCTKFRTSHRSQRYASSSPRAKAHWQPWATIRQGWRNLKRILVVPAKSASWRDSFRTQGGNCERSHGVMPFTQTPHNRGKWRSGPFSI